MTGQSLDITGVSWKTEFLQHQDYFVVPQGPNRYMRGDETVIANQVTVSMDEVGSS